MLADGLHSRVMNAPHPTTLVLSERSGTVLRLTLNRAGARNALSEGLMAALQEALDGAAEDKMLRVIVLASGRPGFLLRP